jgi:hypothetical protein
MSENITAIAWSHILFILYVTLLSATQDCMAPGGMKVVNNVMGRTWKERAVAYHSVLLGCDAVSEDNWNPKF